MPVDREAVVKRADEFVSQGKLDLAIAEYRALLGEQPSDLSAANTLGDLYARAGDIAGAVDQFTRLAESEREQGLLSRAAALYKKALKLDPGCEEALSQLAEIAVGQELLADATLYWNRLVQHRRERNDALGVAQALMRLASLPVAKADTKLAAARAAEPHVHQAEASQLFAAAAEALGQEGRAEDALEAWLEAARRTPDVSVRMPAARACLAAGCVERALPFLTVEVAGDEPALLWAVGERAALADDEEVARRALDRYRALVPDQAERALALLARWEPPPAEVVESPPPEALAEATEWPDQSALSEVEEVDVTAAFDAVSAEAPVPAYEQPPEEAAPIPDLSLVDFPLESPEAVEAVEDALAVQAANANEADAEDEDATIAQLRAAADTPSLQFQASAQLGRLLVQKGELDRGVEWLQRACAVPAPIREHGLAARYDLADALERAGHQDRALACWSDLEFDAANYRDVPERLARLTRGSPG
jgi:tetratricopeptide (TPR) repeat protein